MSVKQRYQVIERIDAGGMAEIFKGRALSLDGIEKPVAIKRILPTLSNDKKFLKMFIDEARLSMRLSHANIVSVFDVGRADNTYFLVMEYVDGSNVRKIFQKASETNFKLPIQVATFIILEICKALAHAHEATDMTGSPLGIVHRDVSPPNLLISWSGEVKITDFGLAKAVSQLERTEPGVVKGKFSYLSPEAAEGKNVDARADIFGAGIILHELLTMRRLFIGKNDMDTVDLVKKCVVPAPSTLNPEIPQELDSIVLKALARDRKKRYQTARQFSDDLANFLFKNQLKVTGFDLSRTIKELFSRPTDQVDNYEARIREMIREEVLSLSMLGRLPSTMASGRAQPIDNDTLPKSRTQLDEVWTELQTKGVITGSDNLLETLGPSDMQSGAQDKTPTPPKGAVTKQRKKKTLLKVALILVGTVVLAAAAAVAYVEFFTEGGLASISDLDSLINKF